MCGFQYRNKKLERHLCDIFVTTFYVIFSCTILIKFVYIFIHVVIYLCQSSYLSEQITLTSFKI